MYYIIIKFTNVLIKKCVDNFVPNLRSIYGLVVGPQAKQGVSWSDRVSFIHAA